MSSSRQAHIAFIVTMERLSDKSKQWWPASISHRHIAPVSQGDGMIENYSESHVIGQKKCALTRSLASVSF